MFRDAEEAAAARAMELASAPVAPSHEWVAQNVVVQIEPEAPIDSPADLVRDAGRIGLRHIGCKWERTGKNAPIATDVFVEPTARAFVSVRCRAHGGDFAAIGARYWIMTLFDDATAIETCSLTEPFEESSERVTIRAGTNDLERDLASHLAAVDARGPTAAVLPARDHRDVLRAVQIYYRQSISSKLARMIANTPRGSTISRWLYVAIVKLERLFARSRD